MSTDQECKDLFLAFQFYSTELYVYSYAYITISVVVL